MKKLLFASAAAGALLCALPAGAADDQYKFMPKGGKDLFAEVLAACTNCDDIATPLAAQTSADGWLKYFTAKQTRAKGDAKRGALAALDEKQARVLATYLAANSPLPKEKLPKDAKAAWGSVLPPDGRQLTLEKCMGCHSLGVTVLNDADYKGWTMIMRKSDHVVIRMKPNEVETLKQYLSVITPMAPEQVPKELRESAGTY